MWQNFRVIPKEWRNVTSGVTAWPLIVVATAPAPLNELTLSQLISAHAHQEELKPVISNTPQTSLLKYWFDISTVAPVYALSYQINTLTVDFRACATLRTQTRHMKRTSHIIVEILITVTNWHTLSWLWKWCASQLCCNHLPLHIYLQLIKAKTTDIPKKCGQYNLLQLQVLLPKNV